MFVFFFFFFFFFFFVFFIYIILSSWLPVSLKYIWILLNEDSDYLSMHKLSSVYVFNYFPVYVFNYVELGR